MAAYTKPAAKLRMEKTNVMLVTFCQLKSSGTCGYVKSYYRNVVFNTQKKNAEKHFEMKNITFASILV